jgi:hypothetical protein
MALGAVLFLMSFWRQILIFLLLIIGVIFCCGIYYIVATLAPNL